MNGRGGKLAHNDYLAHNVSEERPNGFAEQRRGLYWRGHAVGGCDEGTHIVYSICIFYLFICICVFYLLFVYSIGLSLFVYSIFLSIV